MRREFITEICSCFKCPILENREEIKSCILGSAWFEYKHCFYFGNSCKTDFSEEQDNKLRLELEVWFRNCPKWKYIGE